jgi:Eukaryotic-type carbonic anhydrase
MGTVSIFLDDGPNREWARLNTIICAWREAEEKTRASCGLPSVKSKYDGCPSYNRRSRRNLRDTNNTIGNAEFSLHDDVLPPAPQTPMSAYDIILENHHHINTIGNASYVPKLLDTDIDDDIIQERLDFDWDSFLSQHTQMEKDQNTSRNLQRADDGNWFNYFPMPAVKTEYYFRYSGTQTTPPCYGEFISGKENRRQTNHWRVMKDPVVVAKRQISEMHRLVRERIGSKSDGNRACKPDTGAAVDGNGRVTVARPLQESDKTHFKVFCECEDWNSKFKEDQEWCNIQSKNERFFKHPYNFDRNGF